MQEEKHYINSIYYQFELTAKYCKYLASQLFKKIECTLSLDEVVTLDTLAINGEMCQRDLAKIILKDRPSTGRILNSLEKKGYIERVVATKNNRLVRKIILTGDGKIILSDITLKIREYLQNIPRAFSSEKIEDMKLLMQGFREILKNEVELNI